MTGPGEWQTGLSSGLRSSGARTCSSKHNRAVTGGGAEVGDLSPGHLGHVGHPGRQGSLRSSVCKATLREVSRSPRAIQ